MTESTCSICTQIITEEHGGIHCSCGRIHCCDSKCIPEHYCPKGISQRQDIELCPSCEGEVVDGLVQDKEDKELDNLYSGWF